MYILYKKVSMKNNKFLAMLIELGEFGAYTARIFQAFPSIFKYRHDLMLQIVRIGISAMPIIVIIGFFMGAITGIQLGAAMNFIIRESAFLISGGVVLGLVREMIPVLTAMVVVSRMCSSVTAEIGSMVVTEQIDALRVMSVDPEKYIALPRVVTGLITVPVMGSFAIIAGIFGAAFSMSVVHNVPPYVFFTNGLNILILRFYLEALLKLALFGLLLLLIATFYGFRTTGGSVGVGVATVKSVVVGTFVTILLDYVTGTFFLMY